MGRATPTGWLTLMEQFNGLGLQAEAALAADAADVSVFVAERDALLTQMALLLREAPASETSGTDRDGLVRALEAATSSTATLITRVAERTDALRRELRELGQGARAHNAYLGTPGFQGQVNARR